MCDEMMELPRGFVRDWFMDWFDNHIGEERPDWSDAKVRAHSKLTESLLKMFEYWAADNGCTFYSRKPPIK